MSSFWGRNDTTTCTTSAHGSTSATDCSDPNIDTTLRERCELKTNCSINARVKTLGGDPCSGVSKYVRVEYKCVGSAGESTRQVKKEGVLGISVVHDNYVDNVRFPAL